MLNDLEIDQSIRLAILNLMLVLYDCGITEIHLGGVMRILGVPDNKAEIHDNERLLLDDNFLKYIKEINSPRPSEQLLH